MTGLLSELDIPTQHAAGCDKDLSLQMINFYFRWATTLAGSKQEACKPESMPSDE